MKKPQFLVEVLVVFLWIVNSRNRESLTNNLKKYLRFIIKNQVF